MPLHLFQPTTQLAFFRLNFKELIVKTPISNMSALERAFAAIFVRNPGLTYEQVMAAAKVALGGAK